MYRFFKTLQIAFVVLVFSQSAYAQGKIWHRLERQETPTVWFVAQAENEFIRSKIGDWLPIMLVKTEPASVWYWRVESVKRTDNNITLVIAFKSDVKEKEIQYDIKYFNKGGNGDLACVVWRDGNDTRISIPDEPGTNRDFIISPGKSVEDLRTRFSVSRAKPLWKWETARLVEL